MSPFTSSQWQELEQQALIFKHMVSGIPIPSELIFHFRRSLDSSRLMFTHQPMGMGWGCLDMSLGLGRKIDPEPGRCRRTDGKKWRCAKEAFSDSKYCERHMHRGRNRSRKQVEVLTTPFISSIAKTSSNTSNNNINNSTETHHFQDHPHYKSPDIGFSILNNNTHFGSHSKSDTGDYSNKYNTYEAKEEVDDSWQLKMSSYSPIAQSRQKICSVMQSDYSQLQFSKDQHQHCLVMGSDFNSENQVNEESDDEPQFPLRHFFPIYNSRWI
ncbi:hypothetical protein GIB67_040341 [Kingdonia uniflora]|uniref:Growth-regulating factor n=1 Tax=Kingdonia uniflora TaxID=39325 RepID=A0A7J7L9H1_9MAGN|nr:hypothetical protein GIB67_040341 [Kingdonia uniflora]